MKKEEKQIKRQKDLKAVKGSKDVRASILEVAGKLFTENGVKNTSLADIAKNVGISKGTLYYYYSSKEDMIYDITDTHLTQITKELLTWIETIEGDIRQEEMITGVFQKILGAETRGKLHLYLINDAVIHNQQLKRRILEKYGEWRSTLEGGLRQVLKGRKVKYPVLARMMLACLDGLIIQQMIGAESLSIEGIAQIISSVE